MARDSLVIELQRLASDSAAKVSDILRKALLVATKLKVEDFRKWIEAELRGYADGGAELPPYRIVHTSIKAMNPYRGLIPVIMQDSETERKFSRTRIANPMPELEDMAGRQDQKIVQKLPPEFGGTDEFGDQLGFECYRIIARNQIIGIVESVRTMILEWSLKLESEGILGDGMTFSERDKELAATAPSIHIDSFQGVLGDVTTKNLQIGDYASIHSELKNSGISQKERNDLENILDDLKNARSVEARHTLMQRGMDWIGRNAQDLGALAALLRGLFHH